MCCGSMRLSIWPWIPSLPRMTRVRGGLIISADDPVVPLQALLVGYANRNPTIKEPITLQWSATGGGLQRPGIPGIHGRLSDCGHAAACGQPSGYSGGYRDDHLSDGVRVGEQGALLLDDQQEHGVEVDLG